jgi:glucokinase
MTIDSTGRRCKCGNYGCLEAYASGPAIALRASRASRPAPSPCCRRSSNGRLEDITAATVYEAVVLGDPTRTR